MEPHPLSPDVWGRSAWSFLHASAFSFPKNPTPDQCSSALQFYNNLGNQLPCPKCRRHYNAQIKKNPPRVSSREELSRWLVDIHNNVNRAQNKPAVEYDVVKRHYLNHSKELSCDTKYIKMLRAKMQQKDMAMIMLCIAVTLTAIVMVAKSKRRQ